MKQYSDSSRPAMASWYAYSWWLIAPWMVTLAGMHVWAHAYTRYTSGEIPLQFGIYLGHGDIVPALLLWLLLIVSGVWLAGGVSLAIYLSLRRHRLPSVIIWQVSVLFVALSISFLPTQIWDEILLSTAGPSKTGGQLLANAAHRGDVKTLRKLLDMGTAVDSLNYARTTEYTALIEAARSRQTEAVALLLERGANPNRRGYERPLMYAVVAGDIEIVRLLVEHGADPCFATIRYNRNDRSEIRLQSFANPEILALLPTCDTSAPAHNERQNDLKQYFQQPKD
jgi:ankyrin repeat protein